MEIECPPTMSTDWCNVEVHSFATLFYNKYIYQVNIVFKTAHVDEDEVNVISVSCYSCILPRAKASIPALSTHVALIIPYKYSLFDDL